MMSIPLHGDVHGTTRSNPYKIAPCLPITPQYRSLIGVDIEESTSRTDVAQATIRRVMYELLEQGLRSVGVGDGYRDKLVDRGDGIIAPVHAAREVPKTLLLSQLIPALSLLLTEYNREHRDEQPLRMRAAMHAGEVLTDEHNCFGQAVNLCCRLLDSRELKKQFGRTDAPLILVVSQDIYDNIVRQGYDGIDSDEFEPLVHVRMAGTRHDGWVTVPAPALIRPITTLDSRR